MSIEKLKEEISNKENEIRQSVLRASQAQQTKSSKLQSEVISLESVYKTYGIYFKQLETQTNAALDELNRKDAENENKLVGMQQQLQAKISFFEDQKSKIAEERERVESQVRADSADILLVIDTTKQEKEELEHEIDELQAQIDAKREQLAGLNSKIEENEQQVELVRQRYKNDFAPIEMKEKSLSAEQQTIEGMKGAYQNAQNFVNSSKAENDNARQQRRDQIKSVKSEMEAITHLGEALKSSLQRVMETSFDISSQQNVVFTLKQSVDSAESQMQGVYTRLKTLENIMADCDAKIADCNSKIPALNQEKQKAIAQKNFKQAGAFSQQIKSIESLKEQAENSKGQAEAEKADLESSSSAQIEDVQQKKDAYNEARKILDFRQLDVQQYCARLYRRALRHIKKSCDDKDPYFIALIALLEAEYNLSMEELKEIAARRDVEALGEETNSEEETVEIAMEPTVLQPTGPVTVEESNDMFAMMNTPVADEEPVPEVSESAPVAGALTLESAQEFLSIAQNKYNEFGEELERATNEERYEDCDTYYNYQTAVNEYIEALKMFIDSGATATAPVVPECLSAFISAPAAAPAPAAEMSFEMPAPEVSAPESSTDMGMDMFGDMAPLAPQTPSGLDAMEDLASEVQEQPSGDMFGDMSSAPATLAPVAPAPAVAAPSAAIISPEEAQRLMKIAEALYQKKQVEMDDALSNDNMDNFEMLENQTNELESYKKALAVITVPSPAPTAPACFDPNYVVTESAPAGGDDMFGGMSSGGDMFGGMSSNGGDMFGGMSSNGDDMFGGMSSNGGDMFGGMSSGGDMFGGMSSGGDMFSGM